MLVICKPCPLHYQPGRIKASYLNKYSQPARTRIDYHDIRRYGRNILDALKYLMDRGFVLGIKLAWLFWIMSIYLVLFDP